MRRIPLSGPDAPALSDLLKDVPLFADLPAGNIACVRHIRSGVAEHYADGESIAIDDGLVIACKGTVDPSSEETSACGHVLDQDGRLLAGGVHLRARGAVIALRFQPGHVSPLSEACPRIGAALAGTRIARNASSQPGPAAHGIHDPDRRTQMEMQVDTASQSGRALSFLKKGSGPAVIVIHGIGGHKEDWAGLADRLGVRHTVYCVDMLGFGGSPKQAELITIDDQADAVIALMEAEGVDTADIVGNSVGGWVAATIAARFPARVRKLVLVDAAGFRAMFDGPPPVDFYPADIESMRNLLQHVRHDPRTHTPTFAADALAGLRASGDALAAAAVGNGMFQSPRLEDIAARISAEVLVVWGAEDRLFPPPVAHLVASLVPGASLELVSDAGHFPHLDNPAAFEAMVSEFLARDA